MNSGGSPNTPYYPPAGGQAGRVNWLSGFVGFAVGIFLATFVWVQVLPPDAAERDASEFVFVSPEEAQALQEEQGEGTGPQRRVIRQEGETGEAGEQAGAGGLDLEGGGTGGGSADSRAGIDDNLIKLGATVAEDGIAADFLGEVRLGMEAIRGRVNRAGGIHGRQLEVIYKQDGWDPSRGLAFIENLIVEEKVFALAVSPSSEGLNAASNAGLFERHGVPVVGADGLNNSQFISTQTGQANPWMWPVAAATTTQVHIIMQDAWNRCEQTEGCGKSRGGQGLRPAIAFGNTYRFGVEGAFAFNAAYCRLTGGTFTSKGQCNGGENIPGFEAGGTACRVDSRFCGVKAGEPSYGGETSRLEQACSKDSIGGGKCNFVLLLLEPDTALKWTNSFPRALDWERDGPTNDKCCGMAGAQPLFTENFATQCGGKCNRMMVWTGYNPACCSTGNDDVAEFARSLPERADENNQFTMGGYLGMTLLVEALERAGRDLTRNRVIDVLNSMTLRTGLTHPDGLSWSTNNKYANAYAQSWRIEYVNQFNGFQPKVANFTRDPWLGQDNRLP